MFLFTISQSAVAAQPEWYLGIGGGQSKLTPDFLDESIKTTETVADLKRIFAGFDFNDVGSIEAVVTELGTADLNNNDTVEYYSADVVGLYRLYDSQDWHPYRSFPNFNVYAKVGVGYLHLETDTEMEQESRAHVLAGIGAELRLFGGLSLRTDLEFVDNDAAAASLSLVKRFGGKSKTPERPLPISRPVMTPETSLPAPEVEEKPEFEEQVDTISKASEVSTDPEATVFPTEPPIPVIAPLPETIETEEKPAPSERAALLEPLFDADGDGVEDAFDRCKFSRTGYPVNDKGCPRLHGVIKSIKFDRYSAELSFEAAESLAGIASILKEYPDAKVQFRAHTAQERSEDQQMALTRDRLQNMGVLLRSMGVTFPQARFYSFGARVPAPFGLAQDRVEIREQP